jgi:quercetin dioxygenase-like cupin family protein
MTYSTVGQQTRTAHVGTTSDAAAFRSTELFLDVLGPLVAFGTDPAAAEDFCVLKSVVPPGVVVPVHTHPDREVLFILNGRLDALIGDMWQTCGPGCTVDVAGEVRHAFKNVSGAPVSLLLITTTNMGRFFKDIGRPSTVEARRPPSPYEIEAFVATAQRYGYWLGSPEDNAAVGIMLTG